MPDLFKNVPEPVLNFMARRDQSMLRTIHSIQTLVVLLEERCSATEDEDERARWTESIAEILGMTVGPALSQLGDDEMTSRAQLEEELTDD